MRLRRFREAAGLTQEELASRAGLSATAVSVLERGERKRPYPHTVRSLADALDLSEDERTSLRAAVPGRAAVSEITPPFPGSRVLTLPSPPTSLVGRERELEEIKRFLLGCPKTRLLTLTGTGGVGKTRLAVAAAHETKDCFPGGAAFVSLAPLGDPALVVSAAARSLGHREDQGQSAADAVRSQLQGRRTLLVLDNFEHLLEAAAEVVYLLEACPELVVLATSRAPLRVRGEQEYSVSPLRLPSSTQNPEAQEISKTPSGRLFLQRARTVSTTFELTETNAVAVAAICRRLDGLPLALELAATKLRYLDPETLLPRLDQALSTSWARDLPTRQRTMSDTLDWSHDLLHALEKELFRRLSVFAGGFTLEAAEDVCAVGAVKAEDVLVLLGNLVEQSLVAADTDLEETRYGMLEVVRQYALDRLRDSGEEDELRRRHARRYLALAESARPQVRGRDQVAWLARLSLEHDNMRGALAWATSSGEAELAARLGWALEVFWWIRGYQSEGRRWIEQVLTMRDQLSLHLQTRVLMAAFTTAYGEADDDAAVRYSEEVMELSRRLGGDSYAEAFARTGLGLVATRRGDYRGAEKHLQRAPALFHDAGDEGMASQAYSWIGTLLLVQGDHYGAKRRLDQGLAHGFRLGDRLGICNALFNLAQLALARGEHDEAALRFKEGIEPSLQMGDRPNVAYILEGLGVVAGALGQSRRAAELLGAAEGLIEAVGLRGHTYYLPDRSLYERDIATARAELGEEAFEAARAEGRSMNLEQAISYALSEVGEPGSP